MKEWTVLIYANGNNELQPEMWQSKLSAQKVGSNKDVNVVMQLSQIDADLVRIIRPFHNYPDNAVGWVGTKRLFLMGGLSIVLQDLGNINMADPAWLYDFIKWGMDNYPAKHYLLIVGGHSHQFIGALPDYSQDTPYIMGIPEMVQSINLACKSSKGTIDLLILDVCSFNSLEVIYEFGKKPNHAIQNIITYFNNGPLQGLPYDQITQTLRDNSSLNDLNHFIKLIIDKLEFDLIAINIDHDKLKIIKKSFHDLAACYLHCGKKPLNNLSELVYNANYNDPWYEYSIGLQKKLADIILYDSNNYFFKSKLIHFANVPIKDRVCLDGYCRLSFAVNNYWTYLLSRETHFPSLYKASKIQLVPMNLTSVDVLTYIYIMNPSL